MKNETVSAQDRIEWLTELLSQSKSIHMHDDLDTFLYETTIGWRIAGRDDVICLLDKMVFDDLSSALDAAKSLKNKFLNKKDQLNERS